MPAPAVEPVRADALRRSWAAAWVGAASVVAAGFVALLAALSEVEWCVGSLGCTEEEGGIGARAIVLLAVAGAVFLAGLCWSARVSGRELSSAVRSSVLAGVAMAAVLCVVWLPFGAEALARGLVLGTGVAGMVVLREPTASARYHRAAAAVLLAAVASVGDSLASVLLVLLVFPALGVADTVALRRRPVAGS